MSTSTTDVNAAWRRLAAKYAVDAPSDWTVTGDPPPGDAAGVLAPGWALLGHETLEHAVALLPWRYERRFTELKQLVAKRTIEDVALCRFSCTTTGAPMGLEAILYRQFDLLEWITGRPIASIHASVAAGRFANVLAQLDDGPVASIEAGATLPAGARPAVIDRHELIARRGVASDRVVDTQMPQSSVYLFTPDGQKEYTDTDAELFGLSEGEITLVRAALALAARTEAAAELRRRHTRLVHLVQQTMQSDRTRQRVAVEGGCR